jgi:hypothetical protein
VRASGGKERMVARKHSVSASRTAQVGEKFGINAMAFKMPVVSSAEPVPQWRIPTGIKRHCAP